MKIADFGNFDQEVILFGGIHSNLHALEALLALAGDVPMLCTGDIAAYCAHPTQAIALMQARAIPVIAGNCEQQLAAGAADCGCGFDDGSACDLLSGAWYAHAAAAVTPDQRAWMADLPDWGVITIFGRRYGVVHGAPSQVNRFLWPDALDAELLREIRLAEAQVGPLDGILCGHSGLPFLRKLGEQLWVNAGAIGLPAHDGATDTHFARMTRSGVVFERLRYDYEAASAAMRAVGLVQGYDACLNTGWWPSEDILPPAFRRSAL